MNKKLVVAGAILGVMSIILGAFASHGLKKSITTDDVSTFETGVRYQMYHALLMLFVGSTSMLKKKTKRIMFALILAGLLLFSGSIYGLATNDLTTFDFRKIAMLTPIGGLLLISSWIVMLLGFVRLKSD